MSVQETDEYVVFVPDFDVHDTDDLPIACCTLGHKTTQMQGMLTSDDGSWFPLDSDPRQASSVGSGAQAIDGIPIYLGAIKEWMLEIGELMISISIRTDMAWYRLGKPSEQYAPRYETIQKTAKLGVSIITMLKEESRAARLSFKDIIKRVSDLPQNHHSYFSSHQAAAERYVVVHGQIIQQIFAEFPDNKIKKCGFVTDLTKKMEERHHTKWLVKKNKVVSRSEPNLNPRAAVASVVSKRKAMQATTRRVINRIWGEYYSNQMPEDLKEETSLKDEEEIEEEESEDDDAEEETLVLEGTQKPYSISEQITSLPMDREVRWDGKPDGKTSSGFVLYKRATVYGDLMSVGGSVLVEVDETNELPEIYFVEHLFESSDGCKIFHGRKMQRGYLTVLGNAANKRELFLTNECGDYKLEDIKQIVVVDIWQMPWGHQHRKDNIAADKTDRARAEEGRRKHYQLNITVEACAGLTQEGQKEKDIFRVNASKTGFLFRGTEYSLYDYVYVSPSYLEERIEQGTHKSGRNVGLKAYVVCQVMEIILRKETKQAEMQSTQVKVRRSITVEIDVISVESVQGKCEVLKKNDIPECKDPAIFEHKFFCEHLYDCSTGSLKQLPAQIKLRYSSGDTGTAARKDKGKSKETENISESEKEKETAEENRLATLDIFAGCGGLSHGLQQSGLSLTKWAIEYEEPAGKAFNLNHPEALMFIKNCNVILRVVIYKCGDSNDCISTSEAQELAASLDEKEQNSLPMPGQVEFINGGPPCQGFSGMNRFNQSTWSKVQCEMILAFLSFADYFRPKFFLLENVRNFVSYNKGKTFRLTLASLLEMGYQVELLYTAFLF
ncbi:hypothetical protein L6164_037034 [Bauhinia variegata]|uniref:Uncharacterized protein n=1 Tax=Bauhinia variegata TaxID=167791 RepID=A0ACB9KIQ7_BAUVA|nr:hypothetical protein L6164_037034 [Bauhinia variegata]